MGSWLAMKQALTAVDLVMREWGRELELDECGVMILMLLGERERRPACDLGIQTGRARPQVQRSLNGMQRRGLVSPAVRSRDGRVYAWSLTDQGRHLWACLDRGVRSWEASLAGIIELPLMVEALRRIVRLMVNRPAENGWVNGLLIPMELRAESMRSEARMEGLLPEAPARVEPGGAAEALEHDAVVRAWLELWR